MNTTEDERQLNEDRVSLLDYFAGKVIEGCCYNFSLTVEEKAKLAFDLAEQMVKERASRLNSQAFHS